MLRRSLNIVNKELNKEHALTRVTRNSANKELTRNTPEQGVNKEHALTRSSLLSVNKELLVKTV